MLLRIDTSVIHNRPSSKTVWPTFHSRSYFHVIDLSLS